MQYDTEKQRKALFLTSRLPYPPNRGDRVRTYFLLQEFCRHYSVTLLCLYSDKAELQYIHYLQNFCAKLKLIHHSSLQGLWNVIVGLFTKTPFQVCYYKNRKFRKEIRQELNENHYTVIYTHLIRLVPYVLADKDCYKILDYTDCISMEYRRSLYCRKFPAKLFFTWEAGRTAAYEQAVMTFFNERWVISPVDFKTLKLNEQSASFIIPNPVNLCENDKNYSLNYRLIFVGNMSVPHNIYAANYVASEIMPELIKEFPTLSFHIIGANPVNSIKALSGKNNTFVLGYVRDLYNELLASDIFIAPMFFCAGIQNKLLEAMACGVPVVTTPEVADSLDCIHNNELLVATDRVTFVNNCLLLLQDNVLREAIGQKAKQKIKEYYSHDKIHSLLEQRFIEIDMA